MPADRYHHFDAARAILMIGGIVFHAARAYTVMDWAVSDPVTHPFFDGVALLLTSFRMPSFFVISGFFATLSLRASGPAALARTRAPRILVPLVVTMLTVNVLQLYVIQAHAGPALPLSQFLVSAELWGDFLSYRWISHLWFLVCLAWYFAAVVCLAALLRRIPAGRTVVERLAAMTVRPHHAVVVIALLPLLHTIVLLTFAAVPALAGVTLVSSLDEIATYAPYFFVGLLVYGNRTFYESITRFQRAMLWLTVPAALFALTRPALPFPGGWLVAGYGATLWTWVAIYWVLVFFRRFFNRPSALMQRLAAGSYTIYLFHHAVVIAIAVALMDWPISIFLKYPIVAVTTFMVTFALHELVIARVPLLSLLYNGRWPRRDRRPAPESFDGAPLRAPASEAPEPR